MPELEIPDEYLDIADNTYTVRERTRSRRHRPKCACSEECKLMTCVTLCFLFVFTVFLSIALVCLNAACNDNPCNPYCPKGYSPDVNGTDMCDQWRTQSKNVHHSKRSTHAEKSRSGPPIGISWSEADTWFDNMFGGWSKLVQTLIAILGSVVLMLAIIVCCIIPCFKALIERVASRTAVGIFLTHMYNPVVTEESFEQEDML